MSVTLDVAQVLLDIHTSFESVLPERWRLSAVTREAAASTATGWYSVHQQQERLLVEQAFEVTGRPGGADRAEPERTVPGGNP